MNNVNSPLNTIVQLYRMAGKPSIVGTYLSISLANTKKSEKLINELLAYKNYIVSDESMFDDINFDEITSPENWNQCSLTIQLPRDSVHRFHATIKDFINFPSVKNGNFPTDFYILNLDFYSSDKIKPLEIDKIEKICNLIKSLANLAHYHDRKASDGNPRFVYIIQGDGKSKSAILQPTITEEMLTFDDLDSSIAEQLQEDFSANDVNHHLEKRSIFRNTLVEFINDNNYSFVELVKHWTEFRLAYDNNLSIYLSGFNFHKARKEVATAELDFSEKTSKTINELTTKTLAIPVSLVAALGAWKIGGWWEQMFVVLGVAFTSLIINLLTLSQKRQLDRIIHAKELVFSPFKNKLKQYPNELKSDIEKALVNLEKNEIFSKRLLIFFVISSWMPTLAGIIILIAKHYSE